MRALSTTGERYTIYYSADPAVNFDASDFEAYLLGGCDPKHLVFDGEPTKYVFRPLTQREEAWVITEERTCPGNLSVLGYAVVAIGLMEVDGPDLKITEKELSRARVRRGGVLCLPDEHPVWNKLGLSVTEVGNSAWRANFRHGRHAQDDNPGSAAGSVEQT